MSSKLRRGVGGQLGGGGGSPDKERGDGGAVDSSFIGIRRRWGAWSGRQRLGRQWGSTVRRWREETRGQRLGEDKAAAIWGGRGGGVGDVGDGGGGGLGLWGCGWVGRKKKMNMMHVSIGTHLSV